MFHVEYYFELANSEYSGDGKLWNYNWQILNWNFYNNTGVLINP